MPLSGASENFERFFEDYYITEETNESIAYRARLHYFMNKIFQRMRQLDQLTSKSPNTLIFTKNEANEIFYVGPHLMAKDLSIPIDLSKNFAKKFLDQFFDAIAQKGSLEYEDNHFHAKIECLPTAPLQITITLK